MTFGLTQRSNTPLICISGDRIVVVGVGADGKPARRQIGQLTQDEVTQINALVAQTGIVAKPQAEHAGE